METRIRPYAPEDREAILTLLRLNTPAFFAPEEEADFVRYLEEDAELYHVVEEDNRIVACGGMNLFDNGTARISWDMVHPDAQGKGVGSRLTEFRIARLKETGGVERIVVRTSQLAYRFYARFGFEVKEIVTDYWAEGFDLYYMEIPVR